MIDFVKKAFRIFRTRPAQVIPRARQWWHFTKARWKMRRPKVAKRGVEIGGNVRIQKTHCLMAERPGAKVTLAADSIVYAGSRIQAFGKGHISIGTGCVIVGPRIACRERITIGDYVMISWDVHIQDFDPHPVDPRLRRIQVIRTIESFRPIYRRPKPLPELEWDFPTAPIEIGDDVWLGADVTILKGVKIGRGTVVAAGAVVTAGEYPENVILAGVPARVVKRIDALGELHGESLSVVETTT